MKKFLSCFFALSLTFSGFLVKAVEPEKNIEEKASWCEKDKSEDIKQFARDVLFGDECLPADIQQSGKIGNCWLLAALAAIVKNDPKFPEKIITIYDDHFEVKHFKPKYNEKFEVICEPTLTCLPLEMKGCAKLKNWVQIIEMAFIKSRIFEDIVFQSEDKKDSEYLSGGFISVAFMSLLGESFQEMKISVEDKKFNAFYEEYKKAIKEKKNLGASFSAEVQILQSNGIYAAHAYGLVGFAKDETGENFIKLLNPHDAKYPIFLKLKNFKECQPVVSSDNTTMWSIYNAIISAKQ